MSKSKPLAISLQQIADTLAKRGLFKSPAVSNAELRKAWNLHVRCGDDPILELVKSGSLVTAP